MGSKYTKMRFARISSANTFLMYLDPIERVWWLQSVVLFLLNEI